MRTTLIIATALLVASTPAALGQGLPYSGLRPLSPQTWAPPPAPQPYDSGGYAVITPGGPTTIIQPLSPPPVRTDPCIYRLGGC